MLGLGVGTRSWSHTTAHVVHTRYTHARNELWLRCSLNLSLCLRISLSVRGKPTCALTYCDAKEQLKAMLCSYSLRSKTRGVTIC